MFTFVTRDPFGCRGVSCVKLPATVAFPTDGRLLQRIEESRRALPANNMKPLWKARPHECAASQPAAAERPEQTALAALPEIRLAETQPVRIEAVAADAQPRSTSGEPRVVPLARPHARARERLFRWGSVAPVAT